MFHALNYGVLETEQYNKNITQDNRLTFLGSTFIIKIIFPGKVLNEI